MSSRMRSLMGRFATALDGSDGRAQAVGSSPAPSGTVIDARGVAVFG
jgi:hypothetical protein